MRSGLAACLFLAALGVAPVEAAGPAKVRVVNAADGYKLQVDGHPFYVKGAGMEGGPMDALVAAGGNSFRTWRTNDGQRLLDAAQARGLRVTLGVDVARERHGFDYDSATDVAAQLQRIRGEVLQFKDHPALLAWAVGNELNLNSTNPKVWDAVEAITRMIHQLDPNHPVMTTLAGFDKALIDDLKLRAPSLDLIGIQLYGDIVYLPQKLKDAGWTGPYLVTEWGPTGHWEIARTDWGAAIEDDSATKAGNLLDRYRRIIAADTRQCLGSYAFLWGNKQERTPTWYGLFLASGESTPGVDYLQYAWTGAWPGNRSPITSPLYLDGRRAVESVHARPGEALDAQALMLDADGDALQPEWMLREESTATSAGGDHEDVPAQVAIERVSANSGRLRFRAPRKAGAYRLFLTVRDGHGHAAHANFPFQVDAAAP